MNALSSIYAGMGVGLLLIAALLARRDVDRYTNSFLVASLTCSMSYLVAVILMNNGAGHLILTSLLAKLWVFSTPCLFVYVKALTTPSFRITFSKLTYFAPIVIFLIIMRASFNTDAGLMTEKVFEDARSGWPPSRLAVFSPINYAIAIAYLAAALNQIKKHQMSMLDSYSYEYKITLRWLTILLTVFVALMTIGMIIAMLRWIPGIELWQRTLYSTSVIVVTNYMIAFMAISQPRLFSRNSDLGLLGEAESAQISALSCSAKARGVTDKSQYKTSVLTTEAEQAHWSNLLSLMAQHKPYLKNDLRLADLAELSGISANHLSQTINQLSGSNFFDFINGYRVNEAKVLIQQKFFSMTTIVQESGFNSQATFYKQFKKSTGMTPKVFQRQLDDS